MNLFHLTKNTDKQKYSLDTLKLILSVMVVFIHSRIFMDSSIFLDTLTSNGIFRIAVPIFFIINGYYLPTDKDRFLKWLSSSIFLYVGLTIFYIYFWINGSSIQSILTSSIKTFLFGFLHLWYIQAMIVAGILLYFLWRFKILIYFSVALFIIGWGLQCYHSYQYVYDQNTSYSYLIFRNALSIGLPFMAIGRLLRERSLSNFITPALFYISLSIFFIEIIFNYSSFASKTIDILGFTIDVYVSLIVICPFIFVMAMKFDYGFAINRKIPNYIYFIHPLPMFVFNKFYPQGNRILVSFLIAISSIAISYIFLKMQPRLMLFIRQRAKA
ncbi:acyltransferase family protein [Klebsiella pneumoniae]|uniref:acyltransferase family protein n=1 Tax=Klebsiella pneumoniae TaxID=573 RepID=UPI000DE66484|nr:Uncharacterized protein conserved in bacteria [Klebsiella pneumoniae]HCA9993631.1 acyltransferase family protein [Klebsiella pneumoniae]HDS8487308.1 acyltransferase family protein [Klebsiella pneumoniae subsp. pneumoniae]